MIKQPVGNLDIRRRLGGGNIFRDVLWLPNLFPSWNSQDERASQLTFIRQMRRSGGWKGHNLGGSDKVGFGREKKVGGWVLRKSWGSSLWRFYFCWWRGGSREGEYVL